MSGAEQKRPVVRIQGIHHMSIPCNDLDRAVKFYTEVLGMEMLGQLRNSDSRLHFTGANVPPDVSFEVPQLQRDYEDYVAAYQRLRPGETPQASFVRLRAGNSEIVLFQRLEPDETDTLMQNGIYHQSLHISAEDMSMLAELKERGGSGIRFHTGPTLRWPHGRAMYLWDSEGNYLELESEEDLPAQFGQR